MSASYQRHLFNTNYNEYLRRLGLERGLEGERAAAHLLAAHGFVIYFSETHDYHGVDLLAYPNIPIEVKLSSYRKVNAKRWGYQFRIESWTSRPIHEPITILVCELPNDRTPQYIPFIFPSHVVNTKPTISLVAPTPTYITSNKYCFWQNKYDSLQAAGAFVFGVGVVTDDMETFGGCVTQLERIERPHKKHQSYIDTTVEARQ